MFKHTDGLNIHHCVWNTHLKYAEAYSMLSYFTIRTVLPGEIHPMRPPFFPDGQVEFASAISPKSAPSAMIAANPSSSDSLSKPTRICCA